MTSELPPPDDELPPPPADIAEQTNGFAPVSTQKTGGFASLRRALAIFEKDVRTMAKHGLVSSIILVVFLGIVFSIMSFVMNETMKIDLGDMEGGEGMSVPWATESEPPVADAGSDVTVDAGTTVTLDASGSTDNNQIVYYEWGFWDGANEAQLYGRTVTYTFEYVGEYTVHLTVVDFSANFDEAEMTVRVNPGTSDTTSPMAVTQGDLNIMAGSTATFNGSSSWDDVGIADWVWTFEDVVPVALHGELVEYAFESSGWYSISLTVRDESGNYQTSGFGVNVMSLSEDTSWPNAHISELEGFVNIGTTVNLDGTQSVDDMGMITDYTWYVRHNGTYTILDGQVAQFTPPVWGPYEITLAVRDAAGNRGTDETMVIAGPAGVDLSRVSWTSTPFGTEVSFNLLTYAYGIALLSSVIFVGGLFAKGFSHEIQKGTLKVLFFGPISVTTMIFSKLLYPIVIGPMFIFPLVLVSLSSFSQDPVDILQITLVAYAMTVLTMVAAAYGSCIIYLGAKRMVLKPSVLSRMFLYFSLLATLTVFEWFSFILDMAVGTESFGDMYSDYGSTVAMISPFHQGGIIVSNMILETSQNPDWVLFLIPVALIALGVFAAHKLYPDLFSRE